VDCAQKDATMTIPSSKSVERLSFAALAALTLAPIFFQAEWLVLASALGAQGDALSLTVAALIVASAAIFAHYFFNPRGLLPSVGVASLVGLGLAAFLGQDVQSKLTMALALLILAGGVSLLITGLVARLPADLDGAAQYHKIQAALFVGLAVFTIWQTARLSTFMGDANQPEQSVIPDIVFFVNHSCLTAYVEALRLAQAGVANLYDVAHWPDEVQIAEGRANVIPTSGPYAPFYLDGYLYPPQFLLLPAALLSFTDNFLVQRAIWFGFSGLWLALGFGLTALWVSDKGQRSALWLIPLLWSCMLVLVTLQIGNIHHVVMVMAVLGMIAFERKQPALGGALLAFAIVAKISPIFLGVVLLVQRRWRDAAWTFAFGLIFTVASGLVFGLQPLQSFLLYELPRLLSGEAMRWAFNDLLNIIINGAPFSIPFKLAALGVPFANVFAAARYTNAGYTLLLLGLTVFFSLAPRTRSQKLYLWLGVLTLAALQSPFAPGYVIMPVFWIITLLAADVKNAAGVIALGLVWIALTVPVSVTDTSGVVIGLFQQAVLFGVLLFALWRKPAPLPPAPQLIPQPA
jgi:hypothetical protein